MLSRALLGVFVTTACIVGCGARVAPDSDGRGTGAATGVDTPDTSSSAESDTDTDTGPTPESGSSASESGSGGGVTGCPIQQPTPDQLCYGSAGHEGEHFYCSYFPVGKTCATQWKCTDGTHVAPETAFMFGATDDCSYTVGECDEGLPCRDIFDYDARCIVECTRACRCDLATRTLKCEKLSCK